MIEPLGLLHGTAARDAVAAGCAAWLAGGPAAFALVRLPESGRIVPITEAPADLLARISAAPPSWAGLPADRPAVMGILNVTPDSFSDGGLHADTARAIAAGRAMAAAGADVIDVGGESTRPGAAPVPPEREQARVLPVIRALAADGIAVSADTRNASTMAAALAAGARIVNDVSALAHDPAAAPLVAAHGCAVVLMHMRGTPATMQHLLDYADPPWDVLRELGVQLAAAERAGIARAAIAIDPGIGFAKGTGHNAALLARLPVLLNFGCRLLVGASRKGFIERIAGPAPPRERLGGSLAAALAARLGGASVLRVHDVAETVQAVRVWQRLWSDFYRDPA